MEQQKSIHQRFASIKLAYRTYCANKHLLSVTDKYMLENPEYTELTIKYRDSIKKVTDRCEERLNKLMPNIDE